jgi:SWI/SNF-related matrix-associated actin-dependent regulator of chromatin subfamily A member 5
MRNLHSRFRLLLTGTPIQNNLHELWSLLSFIVPDVFTCAADFDRKFNENSSDLEFRKLYLIIRCYTLRRTKAQVADELPPKTVSLIYTKLTNEQRSLIKVILERNKAVIRGTTTDNTKLINVVMQLRKVANHPRLFRSKDSEESEAFQEQDVTSSEKMVRFDQLLVYLKNNGSRVLVFSQMTRMLDILGRYLSWKGYQYCRIDGHTTSNNRENAIRSFMAPGSSKFVFLLSTRAAGIGINLTAADVVLLYDSDWNPQMDLQAISRAHRIGQQKRVLVIRLITKHTVEMRMLQRAVQKLYLDTMILQQGAIQRADRITTEELTSIIRDAADSVDEPVVSDVHNHNNIVSVLKEGERQAAELEMNL